MNKLLTILLFVLFFVGCQNPFAPALYEDDGPDSSILSDLTTTEGIFQNFQYAYTFKDTLIFGQLLSQDFIFTYRDHEQGFDVSWGRDEEMKVTYGLFYNAQRLDLIWNNVILSMEDSVSANYVRGFNLTITLNPTDIIRVDGRVNLFMNKNTNGKWQINRWIDESNF